MSGAPRISVHIDTLRVRGATHAEAAAIASALRESLAARIAADPAALTTHAADHLRLTLAPTPGPAGLGRSAGQGIANAVTRRKGGG